MENYLSHLILTVSYIESERINLKHLRASAFFKTLLQGSLGFNCNFIYFSISYLCKTRLTSFQSL